MNMLTKMSSMMVLGQLSSDEEVLIKALLNYTPLPALIRDIKAADLVVIPLPGEFSAIPKLIRKLTSLKVVELPFPVPERSSFSCADVAKHSAHTVCGLLNKLFDGESLKLLGVVAVSVGCGFDGSESPGPLTWMLTSSPGVQFNIGSTCLFIGIAYADFTRRRARGEAAAIKGPSFDQSLSGRDLSAKLSSHLVKEDGEVDTDYGKLFAEVLQRFHIFYMKGLVHTV